mmetsp:Transcript_32364/g.51891  ORF Transcript_32364/g.51891 Transcript_32364/m.51891 type:complete len:352 (+) Transcript_32364:29-1084(+)
MAVLSVTIGVVCLAAMSSVTAESVTWTGTEQSVGTSSFTPFYSYTSVTDGCSSTDKIGIYFARSALTQLATDFPDNNSTNSLHKITDCTTGEVTLYANAQEHVFEYDEVNGNKFKHLYFNYNPEGHTPPGIYDIAHFDLHWYFITATEREATAQSPECESDRCVLDNGVVEEVTCDDLAKCNVENDDPDTYFPGGTNTTWICVACVPAMGVHCGNLAVADELTSNATFVDTFFMTRWEGVINSNEIMVTIDGLVDTEDDEVCEDFETPLLYEFGDGCYPTRYCYGCGATSDYGDNMCWAYLTQYTLKEGSTSMTTTELVAESTTEEGTDASAMANVQWTLFGALWLFGVHL